MMSLHPIRRIVFITAFLCLCLLGTNTARAVRPVENSASGSLNLALEDRNLYDHAVSEELEGEAHIVYGETEVAQEKAGLPQLNPSWYPSQIFWLFVAFSLMYLIFSRRILPDISSTLENRREQIQNDLDTAENLKEKAEEAHKRYEELMSNSYQKSREIIHKNDEILKKKYNEFMDDFRARSSEELGALEQDLERIKIATKKDMHDIAADLATQAAQKIAGIKTSKKDLKSILDSIDKKAA